MPNNCFYLVAKVELYSEGGHCRRYIFCENKKARLYNRILSLLSYIKKSFLHKIVTDDEVNVT